MINYHIVSTGSQGNAVVVNNNVLIDCGVPFRDLQGHYRALKLVLLTHIHGDHFYRPCIRALASQRPGLRFGCGKWLVDPLLNCGIPAENIDVLETDKCANYGGFQVVPFLLTHDVPNQGYRIHFRDGSKMVYATDTSSLSGISAPNYDLYLIEANHEEAEIRERIAQQRADGAFPVAQRATQNHLSKERADDFIYRNIGANGVYEYLHRHQKKEVVN